MGPEEIAAAWNLAVRELAAAPAGYLVSRHVASGAIVVEHPRDRGHFCEVCGCGQPHRYDGSQILAAEDVGAEGPDVWECDALTCEVCAASTTVPQRPRPDMDGESAGWVIDRRGPPSVGATVRPPAFVGAES